MKTHPRQVITLKYRHWDSGVRVLSSALEIKQKTKHQFMWDHMVD